MLEGSGQNAWPLRTPHSINDDLLGCFADRRLQEPALVRLQFGP